MSIGHLKDLYTQSFDYKLWAGKPEKTYFIATTPRSGSTLLGLKLWQTGMLGGPTEYFNLPYRSALAHRLGATNLVEYYQRLIAHRTSPNGVFGCKLFWSHYTALQEAHPELLSTLAPEVYVFLTRDNKTAQAVSLSRSMQTQSWVSSAEKRKEPKYIFRHIMKCLEYLRWQENGWAEYFKREQEKVITVSYETLVKDCNQVTDTIMRFIDVDGSNCSSLILPTIHAQASSENKIWEERFNDDYTRLGFDGFDLDALANDFPGYVGDWSSAFPNYNNN